MRVAAFFTSMITILAVRASSQKSVLSSFAGDSVSLPCGSSSNLSTVDWWFESSQRTKTRLVCSVGNIINEFTERFTLESTAGLTVRDVRETDSGVYTCVDDGGFGKRWPVRLDVFGVQRQQLGASVDTFVGDTSVTLRCRSNNSVTVDWWFQHSPHSRARLVCSVGNVINEFQTRFRLNISTHHEYNLQIGSVRATDNGLYTCIDNGGFGEKSNILLNVFDSVKLTTTYSEHDVRTTLAFVTGTTTVTVSSNTTTLHSRDEKMHQTSVEPVSPLLVAIWSSVVCAVLFIGSASFVLCFILKRKSKHTSHELYRRCSNNL